MPETFARSIVPSFDSVEALQAGLAAKADFEAVDLYPRDGSELLGDVEAHLATLAVTPPETLLAYGYGMSALTDAIEVGLHQTETGRPRILCAQETYTQTKKYIEMFIRGKRADVVYFDSGDAEGTVHKINKWQPDVIVAETIGNFVNLPVLDVNSLLDATRQQEKPPVTILDNTLPLSTGMELDTLTTEEDKIISVESGTKSYSFNGEALGITYTKNPSLLEQLKRLRRSKGTLPGRASLETIADYLPASKDEFDERNQRVFRVTGRIALHLLDNSMSEFFIAHPSAPTHENHDYYTTHYPDQATPLFYIFSTSRNQYDVAKQLWAHEDVREQAQLGQSFALDHTRIMADENIGAVRISGGANTDGDALGEACAEALYCRG